MSLGGHARQTPDKGIHVAISWTFADAAARAAFTPSAGLPTQEAQLTNDDLGKLAWDLDTNVLYLLKSIGPVGWVPVGGAVATTVLVAGDGLQGGGVLSADPTFNVAANPDGSIVVNPDDIQVGVLATDAQHGSRGGGILHALATESVSGFMSDIDKVKLNSIPADAAGLTESPPLSVSRTAASAGIGTEAARHDHKHDILTAAPAAVGISTASGEGTATTLARSDHTHEASTAPVNVTKAAAAIGTSGQPARADHKHDIATAVPPQGIGAGNSEGSATTLARSDHNHTLRETGGPTDLALGPVSDGHFLVRSAGTLVGLGLQHIQGLRLTGVSGVPVMFSDAPSLGTVYLTPYRSNQIALYNGTSWRLYSTAEVSLAVTGRTADLPFDIFAYASGSAVALEFVDWASATLRAVALVRQDGVWCRAGALTRRYLGTCRPRSATTYAWVTVGIDSPARFDLWNVDNRVTVAFDLVSSVDSWVYSTATWRQAQGSSNYQVDVVAGLAECRLVCILTATSRNSTATGNNPRGVGVGLDSTTSSTGITGSVGSGGNIHQISQGSATISIAAGRHFAAWLENAPGSGVTTWLGNDGGNRIVSGMQGLWVC